MAGGVDLADPVPGRVWGGDLLRPLEAFVRRLERPTTREAVAREVVDALGDLFGVRDARIVAAADAGVDPGPIGSAAGRRRLVVTAAPAPAAAVPLVVGADLVGVLALRSPRPGAFDGADEVLLTIIGAHAAAALAARGAPTPAWVPGPGDGPAMALVHYGVDDTVLCDSAYIVKGAAGRILWSMLRAHATSGRTVFSNRELRLDESLGLPAGNDNLEARLLALRRRLADLACGVGLERTGRGRLELRLERPAALTDVPTRLLGRPAGRRPGSGAGRGGAA